MCSRGHANACTHGIIRPTSIVGALPERLLEESEADFVFDVGNLKLIKEKLDRPKIDFLVRQSKLLGRDNT